MQSVPGRGTENRGDLERLRQPCVAQGRPYLCRGRDAGVGLKKEQKFSMRMRRGREFQAKGTASGKAWRC